MLFAKTAAFLAFAVSASAHLIMHYPVPFAWENEATNQSPLSPADWPCKQPSGAYVVTEMNKWDAGETKGVKIQGGATHGGGSCQISITNDAKPTKDSQWKVIHSVVGQCVGNSVTDNMSGDRLDMRSPEIMVTMPQDLPAGRYTLAWTWLNKLGNREFYMNCAPIMVGNSETAVAAADVSPVLGSLPDMFVLNLPETSCRLSEGQDFAYPNPGDSVTTGKLAVPGSKTEGAACAQVTAMGAGNGAIGSGGAAPTGAPTGSPTTTKLPSSYPSATTKISSSSPTATSTVPGAIFAPGAPSATQSTLKPSATKPTTTQPAATSYPAQPTTTAAPSGDCTPCSTDGAVVCMGATQFGLCNRGCAVAQDLASGMACTNGVIARREIKFPRAAAAAVYNR